MIELQSSHRRRTRGRGWRIFAALLGLAAVVLWRGPLQRLFVQGWWTVAAPLWRVAAPAADSTAALPLVAQLQHCQSTVAALQSNATAQHDREQLAASPFAHNGIPATVLRLDLSGAYRTAMIDRGSADGVVRDMPVLAPQGLVGRVVRVAPRVASVLLLVDPLFAADVLVTRSGTRAVLVGHGPALRLGRPVGVSRLEYLTGHSDVIDGDFVVTSGLDGMYPANLPVGVVQRIQRTEEGLVTAADVVPFIDWTMVQQVAILPASPALPVWHE